MPPGPGAFTVTPFGLSITLPVFKVSKTCHIALLGCSRNLPQPRITGRRLRAPVVCLTLRKVNPPSEIVPGRPAVYHCSWPGCPRCISIPFELVCSLKWTSMDVYISLRPTYREGVIGPQMAIARLMAGSPQRPYQLKTSIIAKWARDYRILLSDVQAPPPRNRSSPLILLFRVQDFRNVWITLTLGHCMVRGRSSEEKLLNSEEDTPVFGEMSPQNHGEHYAVVHYHHGNQCPSIRSLVPSHSCQHHHLNFTGAECRRKYDGEICEASTGGTTLVTCSIRFFLRPQNGAVSTLEMDFLSRLEGESFFILSMLFITLC